MKWFRHFSNARESQKLKKLKDELGMRGYGQYWSLFELMNSQFKGSDTKITLHFSEISHTVDIKFAKSLNTFMQKLENFELISLNVSGNFYEIECPMLLELMDSDSKYNRRKIAIASLDANNRIKKKNKEIEEDNSTPIVPSLESFGTESGPEEADPEKNLPKKQPLIFRKSEDLVLSGLKNTDELLTYWNTVLVPKGFPGCSLFLSGTATAQFFEINKLLRQNGLSWLDYVQRIEQSNFLTKEKRGGPPSLTWLFKESNFDDVMAGKYDDSDLNGDEDIYAKIRGPA